MPFKLLFILILIAVVSCTGSIGSYQSLANRGILAISDNNPYLGTNLFLADQATRSSVLYNFLRGRGSPTAIEIVDENFSPLRMKLYYPLAKAFYTAELSDAGGEQSKESQEWIVRGPFQVSRIEFKSLVPLQQALRTEPLFIIRGKPHRFGSAGFTDAQRVVTPAVPNPTPTPLPKPKRRPKAVITPAVPMETPVPTIDVSHPLNSDQRALLISKGFADRAENGDLIHTVKGSSESLAEISKWYTGSPTNEVAIKISNGINDGEALPTGKKITIPSKLVTNPRAMP